MTLLKNLLIGVILILAVLVGIGFFLPSDYQVKRSIVIDAPADEVYAQVVDLRKWRDWGVWFARDPDMQVTYSGPQSSVGMMSSWKSETEGDGEMTITAIKPNENVTYSLYFPDFEMGSTGEIQLTDVTGGTKVVWMDYGDVGSNPVNRYFAMSMDSLIGPDFQTGLENLKATVEK